MGKSPEFKEKCVFYGLVAVAVLIAAVVVARPEKVWRPLADMGGSVDRELKVVGSRGSCVDMTYRKAPKALASAGEKADVPKARRKVAAERGRDAREAARLSAEWRDRKGNAGSGKSGKEESSGTRRVTYAGHRDSFSRADFVAGAQKWILSHTDADPATARRIAEHAWKVKHGMLLLAMPSVESDFRPDLRHANNYGLCQVSTVHLEGEEQRRVRKMGYKSMRDCGVDSAGDLFDIGRNLCAADAVFDRIFAESGRNARDALVRYNANPKHKYRYSAKVWKRYEDLRETIRNI